MYLISLKELILMLKSRKNSFLTSYLTPLSENEIYYAIVNFTIFRRIFLLFFIFAQKRFYFRKKCQCFYGIIYYVPL